jgi:glycosyltransferase involved in cell wall biosynthesis
MAGPDVDFLGWRTDLEIRDLYRGAAAVLLPGVEDFGLVPVEAQACGTPVIALATGGACETVQDGVTGVLVQGDSATGFAAAISRFGALRLDAAAIRASAERYSRERFMIEFQAAVTTAMAEREPPQ